MNRAEGERSKKDQEEKTAGNCTVADGGKGHRGKGKELRADICKGLGAKG